MKMNVPMLPLSQPNAVGLILAHGKTTTKKQISFCHQKIGSHDSGLCLQEVLETQNRFSPLMCMCLTTAATPGCWPSRAPIITLYWTPEGCWWLWNTPAPLSISSSQFNLEWWFFDLFSDHHQVPKPLSVSSLPPSRFSTDEGQCWQTYNFTSEPFHFSSMDSEPGSRSMNVSLWGYRNDFTKWVVITVDFRKLFTKDCVYFSWAQRCWLLACCLWM